MSTGYVYCACCGDDCIGDPGDLCLLCEEAGCDAWEDDCQVPCDACGCPGCRGICEGER